MPQTAQQISGVLRGVAKDMRSKASVATDKGRRAQTDVAAMRTANAGRGYYNNAQQMNTQASDINRAADYLDEANPSMAMQKRNQAFADAVSGTTVKNNASKTRIFGQTATGNMPGVRPGGLMDMMMRGKK